MIRSAAGSQTAQNHQVCPSLRASCCVNSVKSTKSHCFAYKVIGRSQCSKTFVTAPVCKNNPPSVTRPNFFWTGPSRKKLGGLRCQVFASSQQVSTQPSQFRAFFLAYADSRILFASQGHANAIASASASSRLQDAQHALQQQQGQSKPVASLQATKVLFACSILSECANETVIIFCSHQHVFMLAAALMHEHQCIVNAAMFSLHVVM